MRAAVLAILFIAGALASASVSSSVGDDELQTLWAAWKIQNNREYTTVAEEELRYDIFVSNFYYVQEWNAAGNTAVLGLNKFADLTNEEFGAIYANSKPMNQEEFEAMIETFSDIDAVPSTWDWRSEGAVTPIKNQQQCGSCWAFATVASSEGLYEINGNTLTSFSEQQIVDCSKDGNQGCNGGIPSVAMTYVANNGLETEADYPYTAANGKCSFDKSKAIQTGVTGSKAVTPRSPTDLFAAVYQQPTVIIVEADQNAFQLYTSGTITTGCGVALDHAITAVGYTADYFIVKNSWGTTWGMEGYLQISSSTDYNSGLGACGIFSQPVYPTGLKA